MWELMVNADEELRKVLKDTNMRNVSIYDLRQLFKAHENIERSCHKMQRVLDKMNNNK